MNSSIITSSVAYGSFSFTQVTTNRYATPLPSPLILSSQYAPHFNSASTLLPANITYTAYSLNPNATATQDGQYGQSAYAAMWENFTFSTHPPFTTTVTPTPVPTSELIFPPALYNPPQIESHMSHLPEDFIWGVAGSAWQSEGGLQVEGRGPCFFDAVGAVSGPGLPGWTEPNVTYNDSNVANMHYLLYKQDIARLAAVGIPHYSFSISWSRVVPFGVAGSPVNTEALDHYDDVINTCLEYGITPMVTLLHVDAPVGLTASNESTREHFLYYAKVVMTRYADRVPLWITINEPNNPVFYRYSALTDILLQHADVYHWYKDVLQGTGQVSLKLVNLAAMPRDITNDADIEAALRYQDFDLGIMSNPMFLGQQYPESVLTTTGLNMTALTANELAYLNGTADFYAIDPYVAQFASPPLDTTLAGCAANTSHPLWPKCVDLTYTQQNGWLLGSHGDDVHAYLAPQYLRQQLGFIWHTYRPAKILITEFGFPLYGEAAADRALQDQRMDLDRTLYLQEYLAEMMKCIHEDGVRVMGALAWTFADDNEFGTYSDQFGMQTVNRTDGLFTRTYKRSMFDFVDFFQKHVGRG